MFIEPKPPSKDPWRNAAIHSMTVAVFAGIAALFSFVGLFVFGGTHEGQHIRFTQDGRHSASSAMMSNILGTIVVLVAGVFCVRESWNAWRFEREYRRRMRSK